VLQYRGKNATSKFKLENPERKGESLCSILGCCPGVDLQCFGCHPGLLDMGIPCEKQPTSTHSPQRRDCFCDTSCILFEDCCDDHFGACAELYNVSIFYPIFKSSFLRWIIFRNQTVVFDLKIQSIRIQNHLADWGVLVVAVVISLVMDAIQSCSPRAYHANSKLLIDKRHMQEIVFATKVAFYFKQGFQIK